MADALDKDFEKITVKKIGAYFGAEVSGADLSGELDDVTFSEIHQAFVENEVFVFRDLLISTDDQIRFGKMFGELTVHPLSPNSDKIPELIMFDNNEDNPPFGTDIWHSDETFRQCPPLGTCLRALDVPEVGGDTIFASMSAAYEGLSDRMKSFISGLEAIHDFKPFKQLFDDDEEGRRELQRFELIYPPVTHPIVRAHPVTGKKSIFVNPQFTIQVKGMNEIESRSLLTDLFDLVKIPEYQYRHHWYNNTMVLWDNRSVQHYAVHDYWPKRRQMERVTMEGDRPFSSEENVIPDALKSRKSPQPIGANVNYGGHSPKRQFVRDLD